MSKGKIVDQKKLLRKVSEAKRKERKKFLIEVNAYLEKARSVIDGKSPQGKKG